MNNVTPVEDVVARLRSPHSQARDQAASGESAGQASGKKRDVHGWVVLDKPVGMTSTHAVAVIKRLFAAKRAGHAGTLDPLASGCLPIALGEATKTVPFVIDGRKTYLFTVRWGEERDTDDAEGRVVATSDAASRRGRRFEAAAAALHRHHRAGAAAFFRHQDRRRARLRPRPRRRDGRAQAAARSTIHRLDLVDMPDPDHAVLAAECGKGTYVRALARDLGRALGALRPCLARCAAAGSGRSARAT